MRLIQRKTEIQFFKSREIPLLNMRLIQRKTEIQLFKSRVNMKLIQRKTEIHAQPETETDRNRGYDDREKEGRRGSERGCLSV